MLAIGFASGAWGNASTEELALNNRSVIGVLADVPTPEMSDAVQNSLYAMYQRGEIKPPVERTHRIEELPAALADLDERRVIARSVIVVDG